MPDHTLRAFAEHGHVHRTLDTEPEQAGQTLSAAEAAGIDLTSVGRELEREGVRAFCDSYHQLLACVRSKLDRVSVRARQ